MEISLVIVPLLMLYCVDESIGQTSVSSILSELRPVSVNQRILIRTSLLQVYDCVYSLEKEAVGSTISLDTYICIIKKIRVCRKGSTRGMYTMPHHTLCGKLIMRFELVIKSRILIVVKPALMEVIQWNFLQFYVQPNENGYCTDRVMELVSIEYDGDFPGNKFSSFYCGRRLPWQVMTFDPLVFLQITLKSPTSVSIYLIYTRHSRKHVQIGVNIAKFIPMSFSTTFSQSHFMGMKMVETKINILQYVHQMIFLIMQHTSGVGLAIKVFDGPGELSPVLFDSIFATGVKEIVHSAYSSHIILPLNLQNASVVLSYKVTSRTETLFIEGKYYGAHSNISDNYGISFVISTVMEGRTTSLQGIRVKKVQFSGPSHWVHVVSWLCHYGGLMIQRSKKAYYHCDDTMPLQDVFLIPKGDTLSVFITLYKGYTSGFFFLEAVIEVGYCSLHSIQPYDITTYYEEIQVEDDEMHTCVTMMFSPVIASSDYGATVRYIGLNGPSLVLINSIVPSSSPSCQRATHIHTSHLKNWPYNMKITKEGKTLPFMKDTYYTTKYSFLKLLTVTYFACSCSLNVTIKYLSCWETDRTGTNLARRISASCGSGPLSAEKETHEITYINEQADNRYIVISGYMEYTRHTPDECRSNTYTLWCACPNKRLWCQYEGNVSKTGPTFLMDAFHSKLFHIIIKANHKPEYQITRNCSITFKIIIFDKEKNTHQSFIQQQKDIVWRLYRLRYKQSNLLLFSHLLSSFLYFLGAC